jgi:multiple sugar transport system substrate-binding protein
MKKATLLCLCLAIAPLAAGCGGSGSDSGKDVVLWHGNIDIERKALDAETARFNATKPGFHVDARYAGSSDNALQKVLTAISASNYPDIVYLFGSWAPNIVKSPRLANLDALAKDPSFNWNDFYPAERKAVTVNGKIVGVPALQDDLALVYNKQLFADAGVPEPTADWTWTDFRDAARRLTDASQKRYGWAYVADGTEDTVWRFLAQLWQAGGDLLSADGKHAAFNSAAGVKAGELLRQMAVDDHAVYLDQGDQKYLQLFNSGKIAMLWTGPWDLSSINADVKYGVQILPKDVTHASISGPDMWTVLDRGPNHVKSSLRFLKWFTSPKVHMDYALRVGVLPIRQSETKLPEYRKYLERYPDAHVFVDNLQNVTKSRPAIPEYPEISKALGQAVQAILLGKQEPKAALDSAAEQADSVLAGG